MHKRLIQSNELNKKYTKNQENRIKMEPCDENQQKINKKCQNSKQNGQTLEEFARIDSTATTIKKNP